MSSFWKDLYSSTAHFPLFPLGTASQKPRKKQKTKAEPTSIPALPDLPALPVFKIFNYLNIEEMLFNAQLMSLMSQQWADLYVEACRRRKHLSLSLGEPHKHYLRYVNRPVRQFGTFLPEKISTTTVGDKVVYDFPGTVHTRLSWPKLSRRIVLKLVHQFPLMETLEIVQSIPLVTSFHHLIYLIEQWSNTLITLRLWTWWDRKQNSSPTKTADYLRLFQAINSCRSLRHLTFYAGDIVFNISHPNIHIPSFNLSILSQLETFQFTTYDVALLLFQSFANYGQTNDALRFIELGNRINHDVSLGPQLTDQFMLRFNMFCITLSATKVANIHFCMKARNVRQLDIDMCLKDNFLQFFINLKLLNQLQSLYLHFYDFLANLFTDAILMAPDELPQLSSIRDLQIDINNKFLHTMFDSPHLHHIFPCIERVDISHHLSHCMICWYLGYFNDHGISRNECVEKLFEVWKQCPTVKFIRMRPNLNFHEYINEENHQPYREVIWRENDN